MDRDPGPGVRLHLFFAISAVCTIGRCATRVTVRLQYAAAFARTHFAELFL